MLGLYKSVYLWIAVLFATLVLALLAAEFAKLPTGVFTALCVYFVLTLLAAVWHLKKQSSASAKIIEIASGAWTILMYLTLGGILTITHIL